MTATAPGKATQGDSATESAVSPLQTRAELAAAGQAARMKVPLASHARWKPPKDRPDPVSLLEEQAATRVPELVAIRHGRMMASPGAYYRGAALAMAGDLVPTPTSGFTVQLGGDAHLSNFGLFASPERNLLFDMTDFDETHRGPWEWDLKRLAASLVVAARDRGFDAHQGHHAVHQAVESYQQRMAGYASMSALDAYYARVDAATITDFVDARARPYLKGTVKAAVHNNALHELPKLTELVDGGRRIVDRPPTIYHSDLIGADVVAHGWADYRSTVQDDRRDLLDRYQIADAVVKVVGVGSVGLYALAVLLVEGGGEDPMFLQVKQAEPSVLERFLGPSRYQSHGQRVVEGQRRLQAASDIFLGWAIGDRGRHFYVRQLKDEKGSAVVEAMTHADLVAWARLCGWALARGHAQSGNAPAVAAYLGDDDAFRHALAEFADSYADQNEKDYRALLAAVRSGRIDAHEET